MRGAEGKSTRLKGFELLRRVYDELYTHLSDEFSLAELLQAAQTLIDISRTEYIEINSNTDHHHYGYFSYPVDKMISDSPWLVLENEFYNDDLGDDRFSMDFEAPNLLKRFYRIDPYVHRG